MISKMCKIKSFEGSQINKRTAFGELIFMVMAIMTGFVGDGDKKLENDDTSLGSWKACH